MAKIFLTYSAVPELATLSPAKRVEVIRAGGGRFGKTAQFKRVWLLGAILCFVMPVAAGFLVYRWRDDFRWAGWTFVGALILGYTAWFHVRMTCLRPHLRAYLAEHEPPLR